MVVPDNEFCNDIFSIYRLRVQNDNDSLFENDFGDIVFNPQEKNLLFLSLIGGHFEYLYNNEEAKKELIHLKNKFEDFN